MSRLGDRDLWAGVVFVAIGAAALVLGAELAVGTAAEMGEGYVPRAMAIALLALGTLVALLAIARPLSAPQSSAAGVQGARRWRPVVFVTAAVLAFVAALEPLGLVAAIACSVTAANFAGQPLRARSLVILIVVLSLAVVAIFVWGLALPLHVLPRLG